MVGEMLSQEEINALLGNIDSDETSESTDTTQNIETSSSDTLSPEEIDALGEIGNISMGTAATTLFTLLNHKVMITTPKVEVLGWDEFVDTITNNDLTAVSVDYTEGFIGSNLMILRDNDVKVIADLMMGGTGAYVEGPVTDLHLSAIAESMNQMIGSSSTSMAQIFDKKIDISPPQAIKKGTDLESVFGPKGNVVKVSFRLQIEENIIDSELMQIHPIGFAKTLIAGLFEQENESTKVVETSAPVSEQAPQSMPSYEAQQQAPMQNTNYNAQQAAMYQEMPQQNMQYGGMPMQGMPMQQMSMQGMPMQQMPMQGMPMQQAGPSYYGEPQIMQGRADVDVQMPKFEAFDNRPKVYAKENMDILMDVSLEVSVELGRTSRKIKEILEFGPGSIVELNRLVGEPVDVLVNGKFVAAGEVVVIDENFGIRITDIINPEDRI